MDLSLFRKTFLRHLPSNVMTIPTSTPKRSTLHELEEMADSVKEVVSPSTATMAVPQATSEDQELQTKAANLENQLSTLQASG